MELEALFAEKAESGRRLAVIRDIYRQHRDREELSVAFFADQAMERAKVAPDDPGYAAKHAAYRRDAASYLHRKFGRVRPMRRRRVRASA
jgi:hypothetical protein